MNRSSAKSGAKRKFRRSAMPWRSSLRIAVGLLGVLFTATLLWSQAQAPEITAVRAGRLFDPKSGQMSNNEVVLIQGEKITQVGATASVTIPAGARVIDLSRATVLPGLIDGHVHLTDAVGNMMHQMSVAFHWATASLNSGYTTLVAMGSHGGGFADVELKRAIESGMVTGPRIVTAGPILNVTAAGHAYYPIDFKPIEPDIIASG